MNKSQLEEEYHIYRSSNRYVYLVSGPKAKEQLILNKRSLDLGIKRKDISRIRNPVRMKIDGVEIILTEKEREEIEVKKVKNDLRDTCYWNQLYRFYKEYPIFKYKAR
jgi:hypothetical protein